MKYIILFITINLLSRQIVFSQLPAGTNTDESKVPAYTLADPLLMQNGKKVKNANEWNKVQRPYIYHLFEENVYGKYPTQRISIHYTTRETNSNALNGTATCKQVRIFLPKSGVPSFRGVTKPLDSTRGMDAGWPVEEILKHGYGLVTAYYGDIEADNKDGWKTGIRTTMKDVLKIEPEEWSAIGAWAWGLSRIMDYLEKDKSIDTKKVALIGHSRLGKTALWEGASDRRFSIVISNESGEGGAALSKRFYGETIKNLNDQFPHWFVAEYKKYISKE